jgi:hypothetical protein
MDQIVEPLAPPVGGGVHYDPVRAADYFDERNAAASVDTPVAAGATLEV